MKFRIISITMLSMFCIITINAMDEFDLTTASKLAQSLQDTHPTPEQLAFGENILLEFAILNPTSEPIPGKDDINNLEYEVKERMSYSSNRAKRLDEAVGIITNPDVVLITITRDINDCASIANKYKPQLEKLMTKEGTLKHLIKFDEAKKLFGNKPLGSVNKTLSFILHTSFESLSKKTTESPEEYKRKIKRDTLNIVTPLFKAYCTWEKIGNNLGLTQSYRKAMQSYLIGVEQESNARQDDYDYVVKAKIVLEALSKQGNE